MGQPTFVFVSAYSHPELTSSPHLCYDILHACFQAGYRVILLTPNQIRGLSPEDIERYNTNRVDRYAWGEHHVVKAPSRWSKNFAFLWWRYHRFSKKAIEQLAKEPNLVGIMCWSYPPIGMAQDFSKFAKKRHIQFWFDVHDIHPEIDSFIAPLRFMIKKRVDVVLRRCDKVFTLSDDMADYLRTKRGVNAEIQVIPPWSYPIDSVAETISAMNQAKEGGRFVASYIGNIGSVQALPAVLEAAEILKDHKDISFLIVGSGRKAEAIASACASMDNVYYSPKVDEQAAFALYRYSDVNLITLKEGIISYCCPSKTPLILLAGTPIIATVPSSKYGDTLTSYGAKLASPEGQSIADAILAIKESGIKSLKPVAGNPYDRGNCLKAWTESFIEAKSHKAVARKKGFKGKLEHWIKDYPFVQAMYVFFGTAAFRFISLFLPIKKNRILFSAMSGSSFEYTSPHALYEQIKAKYGDQYEYVWAFKKKALASAPKDLKTVQIDTFSYFIQVLRSRVWITDVNIERGLKLKRKKQYYVDSWHGGLTKGYPKTRKDYDLRNVNIFCSDGAAFDAFFREHYKVPAEAFLHVGRPREDSLFTRQGEREAIRSRLGLSPDDFVLLYMPTWRENEASNATVFLKGEKILSAFPRAKILYHAHNLSDGSLDEARSRIIDVSNIRDNNALYIAADLLLTDYSSSMYDFMLLHKPVLLYAPDYAEYSSLRGLAYDFANVFPGGVSLTEEELVGKMARVPDAKEYDAFLSIVVERDGHSAAQAIIDKMERDGAIGN